MSITKLSVNLNKVALVRNSRELGIPSVLGAARHCINAGAHGITVHPRPDARHIRPHDVFELAALLQDFPHIEYNIEGNPLHSLMDYIRTVRPTQATFVPDSTEQSTSDHGWNFDEDTARLTPLVKEAQSLGVRVSLFVDADNPENVAKAKLTGADRVELYTQPWAAAFGHAHQAATGQVFARAARAAQNAGLEVNAGHDLNTDNLRDFLRTITDVREVSIGHALIADALELGYHLAVTRYLAQLH